MKRDSLAFALSGTFFGLLVGWIIGSQQAGQAPEVTPAPAAASAPAPTNAPAPPLDTARVSELERRASTEPSNAELRVEIANLYFDAQRFDQSIPWYEAALKIEPRNVNASTDLAVAYYYANQVDRALVQIDHSLQIDPKHPKTLLNQGIIRAFGKQDLTGAARSWEQVVAVAPDTDEGRRARQGLDGLRAAHDGKLPGAADAPPAANP